MANVSAAGVKTPLGVGAIVGDSFSILFGNFVSVLIMSFFPTLLGVVVSGLSMGWGTVMGTSDPEIMTTGAILGSVFGTLFQLVVYGLSTALLVQLAYDAKLGRPLQLGRYVSPALRAAIPIAILSLGAGILAALAMIALIIPGLWVYAVFAVIAPAVVIEGAGFGAMGRSAALTKEYRWPVLGALVLVGIVTAIINFVATFVVGMLSAALAGGASLIAFVIFYTLLTALGAGLGGIAVALIYARLREIKEGVSVDQIAAVFD